MTMGTGAPTKINPAPNLGFTHKAELSNLLLCREFTGKMAVDVESVEFAVALLLAKTSED